MQIAIASGKGGTGKTTLSASLAKIIYEQNHSLTYIDCDVEEPNGHLFLNPEWTEKIFANVLVPEVDKEKCVACGKCGDICQFSAIVVMKDEVLAFPELCHSCGGCAAVCPSKAISEIEREVGAIEIGSSHGIKFIQGTLNVGETMSPPLIRQVRKLDDLSAITIIDAPPGTSCPVITAINNVDYVLLVTEPTPFGLSDLSLAIDMVKELHIPHGVVVNRHEDGNDTARIFCKEKGETILSEIPDDRRVAEAYSKGILPIDALPEFRVYFTSLWQKIQSLTLNSATKKEFI